MRSAVDTYSINKSRTDLPDFRSGQTVKVYQKVKESNKERIQVFEGLVIAMTRKQGTSANITVRKESYGIGVERIFTLSSPLIEKIEVVKQAKVRRAKLFYMRKRTGKAARMKNIQAAVNSVNSAEEKIIEADIAEAAEEASSQPEEQKEAAIQQPEAETQKETEKQETEEKAEK